MVGGALPLALSVALLLTGPESIKFLLNRRPGSRAVAMIDTPRAAVELPLDLRGSPIEMAVWRALMSIPIGETRTYGEIAKNLPIAATAQEVGAACAANPIAVVVPCHRVVKADGSVAGYRWGVKRKLRLINREGIDL